MALATQTFTGSVALPTHFSRPMFNLNHFDPPVGFHIRPRWSSVHGSAISLSCQKALLDFPMDGRIPPKSQPSFVTDDHCVLGLYVTHPDRWRPTKVYTTYENMQDWVATAILVNSGTIPGGAGWVLDLEGGAQVCYFEGRYIDPQFKCAGAKYYEDHPEATLAKCLDSNIPSWPKSPLISSSIVHDLSKDVFIAVPRPMPTWVVGPKLPYQDCATMFRGDNNAITHLAWYAEHGGITFTIPWVWESGRCRGGLFMTHPTSSLEGIRPAPMGINFQHEAFKLIEQTVKPLGSGGFTDLVNGWQIVIYDKAMDPKDLCPKVRNKTLRKCLDDLIRLRKVTEASNITKQKSGSGASSSQDHRRKT